VEERRRLFIGGEWAAPSGDAMIEVIWPHTEKPIAAVAAAGPADVDRAVAAARLAQDEGSWPRLDPAERIATVRRLAELYRPRRREVAQLITSEMGSPISFSKFSQATLPMMLLDADSDYGLSGSVWTADAARGLAVARRIRSGSFSVNQPYSMDPAAPFGGVKASGIGRELGREGPEAYVDLEAISGAPRLGTA
jgi:acyl-CoA reductase-like NAD-dependent aldehyde dehydrogenase